MPDFKIESSLDKPVFGIDEVGRGPLAGPVEASDVPSRLRELVTSDCIVLFLGAGDVDAIARELA